MITKGKYRLTTILRTVQISILTEAAMDKIFVKQNVNDIRELLMAANIETISSPLPAIDNNWTWWRYTTVVMTCTLCLWGASVILIHICSLWAATSLHRNIIHLTEKVRARQGAACAVASVYVVGEHLVLWACQSCGTILASII